MSSDDNWGGWGGYMKSKKVKLVDQFEEIKPECSVKSDIFNGVTIHVNGYTEPSSDVLRRMKAHGGGYSMYPGKHVTHVVVSSLAHTKIQNLTERDRIVSANWITDSIEAGQLLSEQNYMLFGKDQREGSKTMDQFLRKENETASGSGAAVSANDPNFLKDFYSRSRLHFISALAQEMKETVKKLKKNSSGIFPGRDRLFLRVTGDGNKYPAGEKAFMHLDMDCFFVSVAIRNRPDLRGKAVVVTHSKGKGEKFSKEPCTSWSEVASCSYEARDQGIKNGMLLGEAQKRCPNLVPIPYDFQGYHSVSQLLYEIVASYTLNVEAVSCDELNVELTDIWEEVNCDPLEVSSAIRTEIFEKTGCRASAGLGPNILVARMATRKAKPNGQFHVRKSEVTGFMSEQKVGDLPGVGRKTCEKLSHLGVSTCGELSKVAVSVLCKEFGPKTGQVLHDNSLGIDSRTIKEGTTRKSVSCDVNYGIRFAQVSEAQDFINRLCEEVAQRLSDSEVVGGTVTLKLMVRDPNAPIDPQKFMGHGICNYFTRSGILPAPTRDSSVIYREAMSLFRQINPVVEDLRGIGITITKLDSLGGTSERNRLKESGGIVRFMRISSSKELQKDDSQHKGLVGLKRRKSEQTLSRMFHYHPKSPSQIDQNVLSALPSELREEIEEELKREKLLHPGTVQKSQEVISPKKLKTDDEPETSETEKAPPIPDVDELDLQVLQELPTSIRKEIEEAYNASLHKSPSPAKQGGSPVKQIQFASRKTLSHVWKLINDESAETFPIKYPPVPEARLLFGESSYEGIKGALRRRTESSVSVSADSVQIADYFIHLVTEKQELRSVQLLLRLLHRFIERANNEEWKDQFGWIQDKVNALIKKKYGATVKIPQSFAT